MMLPSLDFESSASTNSAIPACRLLQNYGALSASKLSALATTSDTLFPFGYYQTEGGIIRRNRVRIKFGYNPVP